MSLTLTAGSAVRVCLLCWFMVLFIHIIASLVSLSTLLTSASSKWLYCSSWKVNGRTALNNLVFIAVSFRFQPLRCFGKRNGKETTVSAKMSYTYFHFESFHKFHVLLDLLSHLIKGFGSLFRLHIPFLDGLAEFLHSKWYTHTSDLIQ